MVNESTAKRKLFPSKQERLMNSVTRIRLVLCAIILGAGGLLSTTAVVFSVERRLAPDVLAATFGGDPDPPPVGINGLCRKTNTPCIVVSHCAYDGASGLCKECVGFDYHSCVLSQKVPPHQFCTEEWAQPENQPYCGVVFIGEPEGVFNDCPSCWFPTTACGNTKPTSVNIRNPALDNCANGE